MGHHATKPRKSSNDHHDDHPWVTLLPWAPQSPDMNIIENLKTLLKQEVAKLPGFCQLGRTLKEDVMPCRIFVIQCPDVSLPWSSLEEVQQNIKLF